MSITKYKTGGIMRGNVEIEAVQVEKETEKSVWVRGWSFDGGYGTGDPRRAEKMGSYEQYHDTWEQAHAYLLDSANRKVEGAKQSLHAAKSRLGVIESLKKPENA